MKIDNLEGMRGSQITEVGSQTKLKENSRKASVSREDISAEVDISDRARLMKTAFDTAKSAPDISANKVAELKERIKNGSYHVNADDLAQRILDEHLNSDFGKNKL